MNTLLAALPLAAALLAVLARWGAVWSAAAALGTAIVLAATAFRAPLSTVLGDQAGFLPVYGEVVIILFGGVLLSELLSASGVPARLGEWVTSVVTDRARGMLLIVFGVIPFAESVTGFGIGIVVGIPLLVQLGFGRLRAAILGLLGLVTVPWGSLAPGTMVAAHLTGVGYTELGTASAAASVVVFAVVGTAALRIATGSLTKMRAAASDLVIMVIALAGAITAADIIVGTPLAGALGSAFAIAVGLLVTRFKERTALCMARTVVVDLAPYGVLVGGLLISRLATSWAGDSAWVAVVNSPALWLLVTCAVTPILLGIPATAHTQAARVALDRWHPVALTTVLFLALGALLTSTRMSATLADSAASHLGHAYPAFSPWIGGFGGFIAGTNTGANAMFAASQAQAASAIGMPVITIAAIQNVSASLATMAAIPKIALATTLANDTTHQAGTRPPSLAATTLVGQKTTDTGRVLRTVLYVDASVLAVFSVLATAIHLAT